MNSARLLLFLLVAFAWLAPHRLSAHDHLEVGIDPDVPTRLTLSGPAYQLALYVPRAEPFSAYLPQFPGRSFPAELTFSAEGNSLEFPTGARTRIELVSVTALAGAALAFWEVGASAPTWTRPTGWAAADTDRHSIIVYEDATGYGHIHGRAFSVDQPGTYQVTFRAIDEAGAFAPSLGKIVTFNALPPPQLAIRVASETAALTFTSRAGLSYDLQVCLDLAADVWTTINFADGTGDTVAFSDPLNQRP